jgi:hypothetical protein
MTEKKEEDEEQPCWPPESFFASSSKNQRNGAKYAGTRAKLLDRMKAVFVDGRVERCFMVFTFWVKSISGPRKRGSPTPTHYKYHRCDKSGWDSTQSRLYYSSEDVFCFVDVVGFGSLFIFRSFRCIIINGITRFAQIPWTGNFHQTIKTNDFMTPIASSQRAIQAPVFRATEPARSPLCAHYFLFFLLYFFLFRRKKTPRYK